MQAISGLTQQARENLEAQGLAYICDLTLDQIIQNRCDRYNDQEGKLSGYNCSLCKNKGHIATLENKYEIMIECECMEVRRNLQRIEKSGLSRLVESYTFEAYNAEKQWQKHAKETAQRFLTDCTGKWFYIGGQVGSGKTHLCTAIVSTFLKQGKSARYMLWRDEAVKLKALVTNEEEYSAAIKPLKNANVLYIDDFFKTGEGAKPTPGDVNVAFELLNYRYNNQDLITIISSEKTLDDILSVDEGTGSRIYQRTKEYCLIIDPDKTKNYRLYGGS